MKNNKTPVTQVIIPKNVETLVSLWVVNGWLVGITFSAIIARLIANLFV